MACALGALPARALASATESSIMMDDDELIYVSPTHAAQELEQMASLGVEQVKISMVWGLVAPNPDSTSKPNFDATNPAAYPPGAWDRYDTVVRIATQLGMHVYFQLTAPPPRWSVALHPRNQPYHWRADVQNPNPQEFGQFVEAVGRRYSGSYVATPPAADPPPSLLTIPIGGVAPIPGILDTGQQQQTSTPSPIPRVSMWGIWNEPNEGSWLNPQYTVLPHHRTQLVAPLLYRRMVDDAYSGLAASGHASDTILIGETASGGITRPLPFVRALYCVDGRNQPLRSSPAAALGCPTNGSRSAFVAAHPGLFDIAGYAHHPYSFDQPPNRPFYLPGSITLYNLNTLERELNTLFARDGKARRGGLPMYLTEFGYKSNPPNPYIHTSLSQQATWLNQGEYMSWQYPYVRSLAQFELVDAPPDTAGAKGSRTYWSTFQSGLIMANGTYKPSYGAYRLPIWVPNARHGRRVTVWGQLRPANHGATQYAFIEFEPHGSRSFHVITEVQTASSKGFLVSHVSIPSRGQVRLAWLDADGTVEYSRAVATS
ncbi:MAG TPA: hypothetical protein VG410_10715 [Solirubrobacteraceae bacterium]|nr:hypothetical protein [Solirubrobacteraceae bacterium]